MKIRFKKLAEEAVIPTYAKEGDAGMDLTAVSKEYDEYGNIVYDTGLAMEIPQGHVGLLFPRSSVSKTDLNLANSVGVVDSGYRGNVMIKFKHPHKVYRGDIADYKVGDRVAQIIILPVPQFEFEEVEELSNTDRGEGGFGSTGN